MIISLYILVDSNGRLYYTGTYKQVENYKINNNINANIIKLEGNL